MRAVVCHAFGPPEALTVEERPAPAPGPGELRIAPRVWGVSHVDAIMVAGRYQLRPELPFVPGLEGAGVVTARGRGAETLPIGTRVAFHVRPGAFAEEVCVGAEAVVALPDGVPDDQGAVFRSAFSTAFHGLVHAARLQEGETLLVHGAGGGTGIAAVQIGRLLGARVIASASTPARRAAALAHGADAAIEPDPSSLRDAVRGITAGEGADVVFDPVGGDLFDASMHALAWGGRLVIVGFTSGRAARARTNHLLIKGASAIGIRAGEFARRNPVAARAMREQILEWLSQARIRMPISHRFPFPEAGPALRAVLEREVVGRAVLVAR